MEITRQELNQAQEAFLSQGGAITIITDEDVKNRTEEEKPLLAYGDKFLGGVNYELFDS